MLIECAKRERDGGARPSSFRRRLSRVLLSSSRSATGSQGKKALACGWQIGVSSRRRLEECGMSTRVDGFPAGKHGGRVCAPRTREGPTRQPTKAHRKRKQKATRWKGRMLYLRVSPPRKRKGKTRPPVARLISLILASGARSLKNKSKLGMGCRNGDRNSRISPGKWN